eukprot:1092448-Prorocentrum_minimum.AAC.2
MYRTHRRARPKRARPEICVPGGEFVAFGGEFMGGNADPPGRSALPMPLTTHLTQHTHTHTHNA